MKLLLTTNMICKKKSLICQSMVFWVIIGPIIIIHWFVPEMKTKSRCKKLNNKSVCTYLWCLFLKSMICIKNKSCEINLLLNINTHLLTCVNKVNLGVNEKWAMWSYTYMSLFDGTFKAFKINFSEWSGYIRIH